MLILQRLVTKSCNLLKRYQTMYGPNPQKTEPEDDDVYYDARGEYDLHHLEPLLVGYEDTIRH